MANNYFDEHGNYINVENLSLTEIYARAYSKGLANLPPTNNNDFEEPFFNFYARRNGKMAAMIERMTREHEKEVESLQTTIRNLMQGIAENARPQGEWVKNEINEVVCSRCGETRRDTRTNHLNFCNHCGANMRKDGNK